MPKPEPQPGIAARHPFICSICDQRGDKGERIVHAGGRYVHAVCHQRDRE